MDDRTNQIIIACMDCMAEETFRCYIKAGNKLGALAYATGYLRSEVPVVAELLSMILLAEEEDWNEKIRIYK